MKTYLTGTLAGAGSFRCQSCGFDVALQTLDEIPECPGCGDNEFVRASIFDVSDADSSPAHERDLGWLGAIRRTLEPNGHYLVYKDGDRVSVLPLVREWTKIGRSLTADIRLDDPTVSRRHALICFQDANVRVLDDRSLNGIFLNGERTEWGELSDGDELTVGRFHLHFLDLSSKSDAVGSAGREAVA